MILQVNNMASQLLAVFICIFVSLSDYAARNLIHHGQSDTEEILDNIGILPVISD